MGQKIRIDTIDVERLPDDDSNMRGVREIDPAVSEERAKAFDDGVWEYVGIVAKAQVSYPYLVGGVDRRLEWFSSAGLWGIESDSEDKYLEKIEREQIDDLYRHLKVFGIELGTTEHLT